MCTTHTPCNNTAILLLIFAVVVPTNHEHATAIILLLFAVVVPPIMNTPCNTTAIILLTFVVVVPPKMNTPAHTRTRTLQHALLHNWKQ